MNETEKENVKEAEEEEEERHLGERAKKKKKKKKQKKKKERGAARRSARSSSGERRRAAAAAAGRGERSDICDFSFFSTAGVSEPRRSHSEPCQSRVGEAKKRKKRDTRRTPESGESYPYRCPTPTQRQKWRVRAT